MVVFVATAPVQVLAMAVLVVVVMVCCRSAVVVAGRPYYKKCNNP